MWEQSAVELVSALFKQQAEKEIKFEDCETAKIKKDAYELERPDFWNNPKAAARHKQLCEEFRKTYVAPEGKVCTHFTTFFTRYAWPMPHLISNEEAIMRFCPFEPTGAYSVKTGFRSNPSSELALHNMLLNIKLCPCEKPECKARLITLNKLKRQRELVHVFSDKLISEVLFQPLSDSSSHE